MNARLCPNCSALIESESALFCYNCGQELEPNSTTHIPLSTTDVKAQTPQKPSSKSSNILMPMSFVLILILVATVVYYYAINQRGGSKIAVSPTEQHTVTVPPANELTSTVSALPVSPFDLGSSDFSDIVPNDAFVYVQSRAPAIFLRRILSDKDQDAFNKKTGLTLTEAISFLGDDYAFASTPQGSMFLAKVRDVDFIKSKISEYTKEIISGQIFGDTLVISDSPDLIKSAKLVSNKTKLPLTQVTDFFEGKRITPKSGQAFIYSKTNKDLSHALNLLFGVKAVWDGLDRLLGNSYVIESVSGNVKIIGEESGKN